MTSPVFADEIEVLHHGVKEPTRYANVRYWLWRDGVTVYDLGGTLIASHDDVLEVLGAKKHSR